MIVMCNLQPHHWMPLNPTLHCEVNQQKELLWRVKCHRVTLAIHLPDWANCKKELKMFFGVFFCRSYDVNSLRVTVSLSNHL